MKTSSSWLCKLKCRGEAKLAWLVCLGWVAPRFLLKILRISSHWKYRGFLPIGNIKNLFLLTILILSPDSWSCGRPAVNYWHICVHICCSRWKGNVNALPTNAKVTKRNVTPKRTKTWSRKRRTRTQPVHGVFYSRKHFGGNRKHEHFTNKKR